MVHSARGSAPHHTADLHGYKQVSVNALPGIWSRSLLSVGYTALNDLPVGAFIIAETALHTMILRTSLLVCFVPRVRSQYDVIQPQTELSEILTPTRYALEGENAQCSHTTACCRESSPTQLPNTRTRPDFNIYLSTTTRCLLASTTVLLYMSSVSPVNPMQECSLSSAASLATSAMIYCNLETI